MPGRGPPGGALTVATCRTCENPQVERALIASGTPIRQLARMTGLARSSLARDSQHVPPADRKLGLVPAPPPEDPRVDPLAEGLALLEGARTERERLKALEQVRAASAERSPPARGEDESVLMVLQVLVACVIVVIWVLVFGRWAGKVWESKGGDYSYGFLLGALLGFIGLAIVLAMDPNP
jgi:hypothetical protein